MKLPWGKHRGKELTDIPRGYIRWLLTLDDLDPDIRYGAELAARGTSYTPPAKPQPRDVDADVHSLTFEWE